MKHEAQASATLEEAKIASEEHITLIDKTKKKCHISIMFSTICLKCDWCYFNYI